jgi:hypothetical protein
MPLPKDQFPFFTLQGDIENLALGRRTGIVGSLRQTQCRGSTARRDDHAIFQVPSGCRQLVK